MDPTFPAEVVDKLLAAAAEAGVGRDALLAGPDRPLTYPELAALYEKAAGLTGDAAFGLHVGERTSERDYGLIGYAAAHSGNLREALDRLLLFQRLWSDAAGMAVERRGRRVALRYWQAGHVPPEERRQECEQMAAAILGFVRGAIARELPVAEVRFEHARPDKIAEHERVFGCPIAFSAPATEIVLPAACLDWPLPAADPVLGALIRGQAEAALARHRPPDLPADALRAQLRAALDQRALPSLAAAARALGTGPRTLQRRLAGRGTSFAQLVDDSRLAAACAMLLDSRLPLAEIAFRLGYSQPSAFHRAFKRVTGITPRQCRDGVPVVPRGGIEPPTP